ncbi:Integrase catalytic core protein [Phytophthora palmivora]|uniref:Integrase catalytic core protein n=1 Tax=Phytophthora palmivora TaxID=4796 RepID=A0A2P4XM43_9STRA|nr:Integrase catalytic core protein [Phytophthora palmivora]
MGGGRHELANELILACWEDYCCMATGEFREPDTFGDAMESVHSMQWNNAADDEFDSLMKNDTWELVPREKHTNVLQNRWIFRVKYHANGAIKRFKARLVIKGFSQIYGIDYLEVCSPVVRLETLRVLLTLAAVWDYEVHQMDVTTAFLIGAIDVVVYMEQPEGYKVKGKANWVCRLKKSLYGLKQAPQQSFTMLQSEACVAVKVIDGQLVFIPLYVDGLILFAPSMELINEMKKMFEDRFAMKDLGELHYILGWEITRIEQRGRSSLYAEIVLNRFNMQNCNGCKTPSTVDLKLSKAMCPTENDERQLMRSKPYRAAVGILMYLMLGTRPDLAYLVRECSQFLENPGLLHWKALKRGLRYLKETLGGLGWSNQELTDHLRAYADADFASRVDDRKSVAGYVTQFCGSIISWSSQTEKTVAPHTTEAEYMTLSLLVQEVVHLRQMLKELQVQQQLPSQIFVDNESAETLASNPVFHSRTKHTDIRHHFVRERINLKEIDVLLVPEVDNLTNAFTKPLARPAFEKHRAAMGLLPKARFEAAS